jgi:hypothetical protein
LQVTGGWPCGRPPVRENGGHHGGRFGASPPPLLRDEIGAEVDEPTLKIN